MSKGIYEKILCLQKKNNLTSVEWVTSVISICNKVNPYQISLPKKVLFKWKYGLKGFEKGCFFCCKIWQPSRLTGRDDNNIGTFSHLCLDCFRHLAQQKELREDIN